MKTRIFAIAFAALLLAGCKANVTYRFDVHADKTVTVSIREILDDQLYSMAASQTKTGDPFGLGSAKTAGWTVTTTVDDNGDHVNTLVKTVPIESLKDTIASSGPTSNTVKAPIAFDPARMSTTTGIFTDRSTLHITIPPPLGSGGNANNPYAAAGAAMAASMMSMHVELKTPGNVIDTNGATTPDGAVRWTLNLQGPTSIDYTVETLDFPHVLGAIAILLAGAIAAVLIVRRRSPKGLVLRPGAD